jgi:hypothetical protein
MSNKVTIAEWKDIWFKCYPVSLGCKSKYKRRLKELESDTESNEVAGKRLALESLIEQ